MPLYDNTGRLSYDMCAIDQRNAATRAAAEYPLAQLRDPAATSSPSRALERALEHPTMQAWDGYGMSPEEVDGDSRMRLDAEATHPRSRLQLSTRVFTAVPDLSRGNDPDGQVLFGGPRERPCDSLSEHDFDRFVPGVCAAAVEHVVPPWTAGGASSRDISRSSRFQRALGKSCRSAVALPEGAAETGGQHALGYAPLGKDKEDGGNSNRAWERLMRISRQYS
jgi:hypothetical protein